MAGFRRQQHDHDGGYQAEGFHRRDAEGDALGATGSGEEDDLAFAVPTWKPKTAQHDGIRSEKEALRRRGAKNHPGSGSGRIKFDGSTQNHEYEDDAILYEVKTASKSYRMTAKYLKSLFKTAIRQGRWPVLLVRFPDEGLIAEVRILPDEQR